MQAPASPTATVGDVLMELLGVLGRRMRQRLPGDSVDYSGLPILRTLRGEGSMRVSALAAALELDASTISRHVRHLEADGLLARAGDPDDGRASRIALTDRGADVLERSLAARRAVVEEVVADWPPDDRAELVRLTGRLAAELNWRTAPH